MPATVEPFEALYTATSPAVRRYLARRLTDRPDDVDDVLVDVYLAAWRRRADLPEADPLPWLYATARRCLANHRRSLRRRGALTERLRNLTGRTTWVPDPHSGDRAVHDAVATLADQDREILFLVGWEELTPTEAAVVLGITPEAARTRLTRARTRLAAALTSETGTPDLPAGR